MLHAAHKKAACGLVSALPWTSGTKFRSVGSAEPWSDLQESTEPSDSDASTPTGEFICSWLSLFGTSRDEGAALFPRRAAGSSLCARAGGAAGASGVSMGMGLRKDDGSPPPRECIGDRSAI